MCTFGGTKKFASGQRVRTCVRGGAFCCLFADAKGVNGVGVGVESGAGFFGVGNLHSPVSKRRVPRERTTARDGACPIAQRGVVADHGAVGLCHLNGYDTGSGYTTGDTGCRWINGNLQGNNSKYVEGDATVQRVWLTDFVPGSSHTVTFKYGTTKGGKHAYDFLTTFNYSETWITDADRCENITGCTSVTDSTFAIPQDPMAGGFDNFVRNFTIRGGTITAVSTPTIFSGDYSGDSETVITVSFTVAGSGSMCEIKQQTTTCGVAIWFGAHVATHLCRTYFL